APLDPIAEARRIEELRVEANDNVKEQHVVSKVILKQFTGKSRLLHPVSVTDRNEKVLPKGPRGEGKGPDFWPQASRAAEELWGKPEPPIPGGPKRGEKNRLHDDPDAVAIVRDAIALHYVRSRSRPAGA